MEEGIAVIFAGILAGGKGERMNSGLPKQFMRVCGKPVLYYSVSRFCDTDQIGMVVISCHPAYASLAEQVAGMLEQPGKIRIIGGGETRHQSIMNIIQYIKVRGYEPGDKIILHEAARPLVDADVIREHVKNLDSFEATNTLFAAVDTMMMSQNGQFIDQVPPKKHVYHGQGPQGYDLEKLIRVLENEVTAGDLQSELDLCALYVRNNRSVKIIPGNEKLFKVTYPDDFALLEHYLRKAY